MKVIVGGAGIAGLSVAHALARHGITPTVVAPDGGASAAGAGIVSAQFWDARMAPLARRSQRILRGLVTVHACGMAQIALSESAARRLRRLWGVRHDLPPGMVRRLAPGFLQRIVHATWSAEDFWVSPQGVLRELSRGIPIVRARILAVERGRVRTDRGTLAADRIVLALGARTPGPRLELRRSQLARVRCTVPAMFHVLDTGLYARPDRRGVLAGDGDAPWRPARAGDGDAPWRGVPADEGDTPRRGGAAAALASRRFARRVAAEMAQVLRRPTGSRIPAGAPVAAGILAFTRSGRPILRRRGRVWILAGLGGDGLALAPACGERLARALLRS